MNVLENLREAEGTVPALVEYAGERDVKLTIENCVMEGSDPDRDPGAPAYSFDLSESTSDTRNLRPMVVT